MCPSIDGIYGFAVLALALMFLHLLCGAIHDAAIVRERQERQRLHEELR